MPPKRMKKRNTAKEQHNDEPTATAYFVDNFTHLLTLLDSCIKHIVSTSTAKSPSGTDDWQTWCNHGLLKSDNRFVDTLRALGIEDEEGTVKHAFEFLLSRIPELGPYLLIKESINDDYVTVAVYDTPRKRSARTYYKDDRRSDLAQKAAEPLPPNTPTSPPAKTTNVEGTGLEQDVEPLQTSDDSLPSDLKTSEQQVTELKDSCTALNQQVNALLLTLNRAKEEFALLKDDHKKFVATTESRKKEMKTEMADILSKGIEDLKKECLRCNDDISGSRDDIFTQMQEWSASFSRKCLTTLDTVENKLARLVSDQNQLSTRNNTKAPQSPVLQQYAPSTTVDLTMEPNGKESLFGNTYYLGGHSGKTSVLDHYEFPKGTSYSLDAKYFLKTETNSISTISSKEEIIAHFKQYVAAAHRFGILITPSHQVTRWVNEEYPPTCPFNPQAFQTKNHFDHVYTQSSTAIYAKLKTTIDESWREGWNLIEQEDVHCDGYKVLYRLLEQVHPALNNEAEIIMEPKYTDSDDVFSFCKKYGHYIGYQRGMGNNVSDHLAYNYVTQIISNTTTEYSDGLSECQKLYRDYMHSLERWQYSGQHPETEPIFPRLLKLDELPLTISKYSKVMRDSPKLHTLHDMALEDWTDDDVFGDARVRRLERRQQLDEFCRGCGRYGHNLKKTGQCDIVAQVSNALSWLKSAKPSELQAVLKSHKEFQRKRRSSNKARTSSPSNQKNAKVHVATALDYLTQLDLTDDIDNNSSSDSSDNIEE